MCHLLWDYVEKARTPSNVLECSRRLAPSSVGASGERLSGRIATHRSHCNTNASVTVLIIRGWLRVRVAAARIQGKKSKFDSDLIRCWSHTIHGSHTTFRCRWTLHRKIPTVTLPLVVSMNYHRSRLRLQRQVHFQMHSCRGGILLPTIGSCEVL